MGTHIWQKYNVMWQHERCQRGMFLWPKRMFLGVRSLVPPLCLRSVPGIFVHSDLELPRRSSEGQETGRLAKIFLNVVCVGLGTSLQSRSRQMSHGNVTHVKPEVTEVVSLEANSQLHLFHCKTFFEKLHPKWEMCSRLNCSLPTPQWPKHTPGFYPSI